MLIPRGRKTAYISQDANCHVNWRGVGSGLVHVIHIELTAMILIVSSMGVPLSLPLKTSTAEQQPRSGEYSKGLPSSRCVKQSHQSNSYQRIRLRGMTMHQHLAALLRQKECGWALPVLCMPNNLQACTSVQDAAAACQSPAPRYSWH